LKCFHYDFEDEWLDQTPAKRKRFIKINAGGNIRQKGSFENHKRQITNAKKTSRPGFGGW
jgi:Holliday junction resolvase RusA-like endonuclease